MRHLCALVSALLLFACHDDMHGGNDPMRADLSVARAEVTRHHDATFAATTLAEMQADTLRHDQTMTQVMADMHGAMDAMPMSCDCSSGGGTGMSDMTGMMNEMGGMMTDHTAAMSGMDTMDHALTECASHTAAMMDELDHMESMLDDMSCM